MRVHHRACDRRVRRWTVRGCDRLTAGVRLHRFMVIAGESSTYVIPELGGITSVLAFCAPKLRVCAEADSEERVRDLLEDGGSVVEPLI
ncbi:hypothetical protein [Halosolutus halophilus]|uniref:hypothetical protein n=1 Tax=Halosolutus halophilus TaxID=1552990 RepID=UPI0022350E7C|nr:hypothetical protein [Halosolutus halophilus]